VQISQVSRACPDGVNEDYVCTGADRAIVLTDLENPLPDDKQRDDATAVYLRLSETL
jgi:hypothetical protein